MTITEFLLARLDEDEAAARAADGALTDWDSWPAVASDAIPARKWEVGNHIARHDPARVLAEVAAKRAIVELAQHVENFEGGGAAIVMRDGYRAVPPGFGGLPGILPLLASVYSTHPDYQANWA